MVLDTTEATSVAAAPAAARPLTPRERVTERMGIWAQSGFLEVLPTRRSDDDDTRPATARIRRPVGLQHAGLPSVPLTARPGTAQAEPSLWDLPRDAILNATSDLSVAERLMTPQPPSASQPLTAALATRRFHSAPPPLEPPAPPPSRLGLGGTSFPHRRMLERPQTTAASSAEDEGEQRVRRNELLGQSLRALTFGSQAPQSVREHAPSWWKPDEMEETAMTEWDTRHASYLKRGTRAIKELRADPSSLAKESANRLATWEISHNRFFLREKIGGIKTYEKKKKKKAVKRWKLVNSMWGPRRKSCDAKDFYDHPEVKHRAFDVDWEIAREKHGLDKKLAKAVKGLEAEEQAKATPQALKAALFQHYDILNQVFHYYCSLGASDDIYSLSNNAWLQIIREAELANNAIEGQRDADLQLMFEGANAKAAKGERFNKKDALNREEWIAVVAQLIMRRHVESNNKGLEEAVYAFFVDDLARNVPSVCLQDSNLFRAEYCYVEATDLVLKKYENSLRNLFSAFAVGDGAIGHEIFSTKLLDFREYMGLINKLDVVDPFINIREVRLNFIWSRMVVVSESTVKGRSNLVQLSFEDFLELVVRFAHMKALPTPEDLEQSGLTHAGEFLAALAEQPDAEEKFKQERNCEPGEECAQPIAWKVRQFILWMIFAARGGHGDPEQELTKKEAELFKQGKIGRSISLRKMEGEREGKEGAGSPIKAEEPEEEVELKRDEKTAPKEFAPPAVSVLSGVEGIGTDFS